MAGFARIHDLNPLTLDRWSHILLTLEFNPRWLDTPNSGKWPDGLKGTQTQAPLDISTQAKGLVFSRVSIRSDFRFESAFIGAHRTVTGVI
jgi:hypothetical protein